MCRDEGQKRDDRLKEAKFLREGEAVPEEIKALAQEYDAINTLYDLEVLLKKYITRAAELMKAERCGEAWEVFDACQALLDANEDDSSRDMRLLLGDVFLAMADKLYECGQFVRAIYPYEQACRRVESSVHRAFLHENLGRAYEVVGQYDRAAEVYDEAHRIYGGLELEDQLAHGISGNWSGNDEKMIAKRDDCLKKSASENNRGSETL